MSQPVDRPITPDGLRSTHEGQLWQWSEVHCAWMPVVVIVGHAREE